MLEDIKTVPIIITESIFRDHGPGNRLSSLNPLSDLTFRLNEGRYNLHFINNNKKKLGQNSH